MWPLTDKKKKKKKKKLYVRKYIYIYICVCVCVCVCVYRVWICDLMCASVCVCGWYYRIHLPKKRELECIERIHKIRKTSGVGWRGKVMDTGLWGWYWIAVQGSSKQIRTPLSKILLQFFGFISLYQIRKREQTVRKVTLRTLKKKHLECYKQLGQWYTTFWSTSEAFLAQNKIQKIFSNFVGWFWYRAFYFYFILFLS